MKLTRSCADFNNHKPRTNWGKVLGQMLADKKLIEAYLQNPSTANKKKFAHIKFVKPFYIGKAE